MKNKETILKLGENSDSFFLYDESIILSDVKKLKDNFPNIEILYSIKSNPNPHVVSTVLSQGFGSDAASLKEVMLSKANNLPKDQIFFSAPGKNDTSIRKSMDDCILIADSLLEIERINKIAKEMSKTLEIGVRINPDFTFTGDVGAASKFGIDEQALFAEMPAINKMENIVVTGMHIHLKSQELEEAALNGYYEKMLKLARRFQTALKAELKFVNMGSGLGVPYSITQEELDVSTLGKKLLELANSFKVMAPNARIMLETGRYAVCHSGTYVTKVIDFKTSYGKKIAILNNTLNGFMRPSIEQLVTMYGGPDAKGAEPLYTVANAFPICVYSDEKRTEAVTLYGNLCTSSDLVAKDLVLPKLAIGDLLGIANAGSYGATLSPVLFSSLVQSPEFFLTVDGEILQ